MPSPLGHFLAGLSVGIAADPEAEPSTRPVRAYATRFALVCAALGMGPDLDLLMPDAVIYKFHRTATHSLFAVSVVFIVSMLVTGKVTSYARRVWWSTVFALSWGSHLLLDWLGTDPSRPAGIQLLWPFSTHFFISGVNFFPATERFPNAPYFLLQNLTAAVVEICVGIPLVALAMYLSSRRGRRDSAATRGNAR